MVEIVIIGNFFLAIWTMAFNLFQDSYLALIWSKWFRAIAHPLGIGVTVNGIFVDAYPYFVVGILHLFSSAVLGFGGYEWLGFNNTVYPSEFYGPTGPEASRPMVRTLSSTIRSRCS